MTSARSSTWGTIILRQQQLDQALEHYKKTSELAPNFSQVYNLMGYCLRQKGDYAASEQAFKKYIELIPNDPNPYDSYAELAAEDGAVRRVDCAVPESALD